MPETERQRWFGVFTLFDKANKSVLVKSEEMPQKSHCMQEGVSQGQSESLFFSNPQMGRGNGFPIAKNKIK